MGLRIRTNIESVNAQRSVGNNQADLNSSMEKLASGYRINKSADDAAGLAISESLKAKVRGLAQAKRNASDGISMVQVAEGGLNEVGNILVRLRELAVQASSDTVGEKERGFLDKEYSALVKEVDRISETTEFNGTKLLGPQGKDSGLTIQVGYNNEKSDALNLTLGDAPDGMSASALGIGETSIGGTDREAIAGNLSKIDDAIYKVTNSRAEIGAMQSRLQTAIGNISVTSENLSAANSRIRDLDYAEETAKMTQSKIMSQSSLSVLTQANQKPEMALSLLRN